MDGHMGIVMMAETKEKLKQIKKKENKEKKGRQVHHHLRVKHLKLKSILPLSLRLNMTQRNQRGNNPPEQPKKRFLLTFRSEESSPIEKQKTKKKIQTRAKKIPEVNLGSDDPLSQGHTDQSSINKLEHSIALIKVYLPLSQTTPVPEIEPTPAKSPSEKINEETTKSTPKPPPKPEESTMTLLLAPPKIVKFGFQYHSSILTLIVCYMSSRSNPAPEDTATLMMMAWTASYVPKEGPIQSFSLGLTDSSQEEAATQEGQRAKTPEMPNLIEQLGELVEKIASSGVKTEGKSPQIQKQSGEESFEKFETPVRTNEMSAEMNEKCYIWTTRVKTYGDGSTNEYNAVCTLNAQDRYILSKVHFTSLKADTHIEAEQNIKRFQEEVYCLPPDIVNMAVGNHPNGEFLQPKTNKPFRVEDYPMK
ncbi:hypothetical protein Ahy_Scaffold2g107583 [Arachis hypogaea]|uniref:Uncharacterized protein n=1 Tax=Arachis hypogaea TaxID=3818 RepID=A0A444WQE0_ARAHY|nr:hypothetical protein Ahy_Scaffold2g107583 [Arachis hypogaea]